MGGAALGALMLAPGSQAWAACSATGSILDCSGDLSGGVAATDSTSLLTLQNLTASIAPAVDVDGISFLSDGSITINSNLGSYHIATTGDYGIGIEAKSYDGGSISIHNTGNVSAAAASGIYAESSGDISVTNVGTVDAAGLYGIGLHGIDSGSASLNQTGNVTNLSGAGIAVDSNGGVSVTTTKTDILSSGNGLSAVSHETGNAIVNEDGNITSTGGLGIYAWSQGTTTVNSNGDISAYGNAIQAESHALGDVSVDHTGNLTSTTADGVFATSSGNNNTGAVSVIVDGTIEAAVTGIHAASQGGVSVIATGDITGTAGYGIDATSSQNAVSVTYDGTIQSGNSGIYAIAHGGTVTVQADGSITSSTGYGIDAEVLGVSGSNGNVIVTGDSNIVAGVTGIYAKTSDGALVSIDHSGTIEASGRGIDAQAPNGSVEVTNDGSVSTTDTAIYARSSGGHVTIDQTGDLTSTTGYGVYADVEGVNGSNGNVSVTVDGAITASAAENALTGVAGIYATTTEGASVSVTHSGGDINVTQGVGIVGLAPNGAVSIYNTSNIIADGGGIYAESDAPGHDAGAVSVTQYGDITSGGIGIDARSAEGVVTVVSGDSASGGIKSNIHSDGTAINVKADDNNASVTQYGNVTSDNGSGIVVATPNGTATVTGAGTLTAHTDGINIDANGYGNTVSVDWSGNITGSNGTGVKVSSDNTSVSVTTDGTIWGTNAGIDAMSNGGSVTVDQSGSTWAWGGTGISAVATGNVDVTAGAIEGINGIVAKSTSDGTVAVTANGNINAEDGAGGVGISASSTNAAVTITAYGTVLAKQDAIDASNSGYGTVSVTAYDDVTSDGASAIVASSATGIVTITTAGNVTAQNDGIVASNTGYGAVSVTQTGGDLSAWNGTGISATSSDGAVTVQSSGNLIADLDGIYASNQSDATVQVTHDGGSLTSYERIGIDATSSTGKVIVDNTGDITAAGPGIFAYNQSDTNAVTVNSTGNVTSTDSYGIAAASSRAAVNVTVDGNVTGQDAGIVTGSYGNLSVTVNGGTVSASDGPAVSFLLGNLNKLTNYGTVGDSVDALAVQSTNQVWNPDTTSFDEIGSSTTIDNYGTLNGNVDLAEAVVGYNSLLNESTGLFNMGSSVDLGANGQMTNYGALSIGDVGTVASTTLNGSLVNGSAGTILLDVDMANELSDTLAVTGTASLSGTLGVHLDSFATGASSYTFLTADGGVTNGSTLAVSNPVLDAYVTTDANTATLVIDGYNFAPQGTTGNSITIGDYINASLANSNALYDIAAGLASLTTVSQVNQALAELSPEIYMNQQASANLAMTGFSDNLLSCRVADGAYVFGAEGQCAWVRSDYKTVSRDSSGGNVGYDSHSWNFAGGAQYALSDDIRVGAAIGGSSGSMHDDVGGHSTNDTVSLGAVIKYVPGPWLLAASVSGSYGWYNSGRDIAFGGYEDNVSGKSKLGIVDARLRAAYTLQSGDLYAKPQVDADALYTNRNAFTESGGTAAVNVNGSDETVFSVSPTLELGGQLKLANAWLLRPYVRGGVTAYSNDESKLTGTFAADTMTEAFTVTSSNDQYLWKAAAGIDVLGGPGSVLRVMYEGDFGSTTTSQTFGAKYSLNY